MKIFIICDNSYYNLKTNATKLLEDVKNLLEAEGHEAILPTGYDDPEKEARMRSLGDEQYVRWKTSMLRLNVDIVGGVDAVFVVNGAPDVENNYIGGATFATMCEAFRQEKRIFLYCGFPSSILNREIMGMGAIPLYENVRRIRDYETLDNSRG